MINLKPCPFCGSEVQDDPHTGEKYPRKSPMGGWIIHCECCGASLSLSQRKYVKDGWNTRPIEDALRARIAELEEKQRWIPVSERLPDNWKPVMTIDVSESTRVPVPAFYDPETSLWSTHLPNYDLWVTHWMPLPEPPIVRRCRTRE